MEDRGLAALEELARLAGVRDARVLAALGAVPRKRFIPPPYTAYWSMDRSFEIGAGQTISQPTLVARMLELLELRADARVLEIGAGSGYEAVLLSRLAAEVHTVEILPALVERLAPLLAELGAAAVRLHEGDGFGGWPAAAPYDAIVVSCAIDRIPEPLVAQLKPGGRLVLPVGPHPGSQRLTLVVKRADGSLDRTEYGDVVFVPMTGGSIGG
ncbi:MAG: protein-L-isoaspartate(D-aspartate) O-methyltransferase [bacterium]